LDKQQSLVWSLPSSEFQTLCDELGGPADVSIVEREALDLACREFCFARTWPAFQQWEQDQSRSRRYWPWVALAAFQYKFERAEKENYDDEPTPSKLETLVAKIATDARTLLDDLTRLQTLSYRLRDPDTPNRRGHLAWIYQYIAHVLVKGPQANIDEDPAVSSTAFFAMQKFYQRLIWLEVAAKEAAQHISRELLTRPTGPKTDPGLGYLVAHSMMIWEHMTGRPASVNRVAARAVSHDDRPDFAIFVTNIAKLACDREPTLGQIHTAFHTPYCEKRKSQ
jgi:hypothetical protein